MPGVAWASPPVSKEGLCDQEWMKNLPIKLKVARIWLVIPALASVATMAPEGALACTSSIPRQAIDVFGLADVHDILGMVLALQRQLVAEAPCLLELPDHIPPHGCGAAAAEGVGVAHKDHAMHCTRQKDVDPVGGVQESGLPHVIAADERDQNHLALLPCMCMSICKSPSAQMKTRQTRIVRGEGCKASRDRDGGQGAACTYRGQLFCFGMLT